VVGSRRTLEGYLKRLNPKPVSPTKLELYILPNMVAVDFDSK